MIGFVTSPRYVEHCTGPHHPERPDRIRAIMRAVREAGLVDSPSPFPNYHLHLGLKPLNKPKLLEIAPYMPDEQWLLTVHTPEHVQHIKRVCRAGGGILDQGDTPVGKQSFEIAMLSLGGAMAACDAVMSGKVRRAFAAVRPPGHHAEPNRAMGFCLFSNVAICARYLQRRYGIARIGIVDFDVHHGNGTQAAFENDPSVLFVSMHENPRTCYPGTGHDWEIGTGRGRGYTINVPFDPGAIDAEYMRVTDLRILPELELFRPEVLLVSAGFDAHRDDPLANVELSEEGYEQMTHSLVAIAEQQCQGRLISVLEGGYNLRALGRSVVRHLVAMM